MPAPPLFPAWMSGSARILILGRSSFPLCRARRAACWRRTGGNALGSTGAPISMYAQSFPCKVIVGFSLRVLGCVGASESLARRGAGVPYCTNADYHFEIDGSSRPVLGVAVVRSAPGALLFRAAPGYRTTSGHPSGHYHPVASSPGHAGTDVFPR